MEEEQNKEQPVNSLLEEASRLKAELEALKNDTAPMIKELQELKARDILGGRTNGGSKPEEPKEDSPKEYMEKVMRGDLNGN